MSDSLETPWTVARLAPLSMEFSGQEYWRGVLFPSPGDLPDPGVEPRSALQADSLLSEPAGEAQNQKQLCPKNEPCEMGVRWGALPADGWYLATVPLAPPSTGRDSFLEGLTMRIRESLHARTCGTLCPRSGDISLGANKELVLRA